MAEYGPLGSSSKANIFLTASFTLIYILFRPQVTRRLLHRPLLVYRMPNLLCIDGIPVSNDEKAKAELYFLEQQVCFYSGRLLQIRVFFLVLAKFLCF